MDKRKGTDNDLLQIERKEPYHESDVNSIPREGLANVAPVV